MCAAPGLVLTPYRSPDARWGRQAVCTICGRVVGATSVQPETDAGLDAQAVAAIAQQDCAPPPAQVSALVERIAALEAELAQVRTSAVEAPRRASE